MATSNLNHKEEQAALIMKGFIQDTQNVELSKGGPGSGKHPFGTDKRTGRPHRYEIGSTVKYFDANDKTEKTGKYLGDNGTKYETHRVVPDKMDGERGSTKFMGHADIHPSHFRTPSIVKKD